MATYFHGNPEISVGQDGGLQTMVLMNPTTYVHYNNSASDQNPPPPPPPQHSNSLLLLNPSSASAAAGNLLSSPHAPPQQFDNVSVLHGFIPPVHYNLYGTPTESPTHHASDTPRAQQGLSLSLSRNTCSSGFGHAANVVVSGMQGLVLSSKYLKAAQELLDEVASVSDSRTSNNKSGLLPKRSGGNSNKESPVGDETGGGGETGSKVAAELTAAERQEIQMKKAKLISMLDEVDQRYRQYHQQMQIIISTFEQAAGTGSAKTYTSLALKTISKQFRSLKDTITAQIRAANKSLGEEDSKNEGGSSRLKFVDHHLRQQRALQQLGMIQHNNAWRPQRGLPERAVSVLRAWLFEHFLHPYPKDSDKIMLAKQTGLTRSQVSNWFINARVRLWKPMVEEMYLEEMKEQEKSNGSEEKTGKREQQQNDDSACKSIGYNNNQDKSPVLERQRSDLKSKQRAFVNKHSIIPSVSMLTSGSTSPAGGSFRNPLGFPLIGSLELEGIAQGSPKKPRSIELMQSPTSVPSVNMDVNKVSEARNEQFSMKLRDETQYSFIENNANFMGGFGQYHVGETARFEAEPFTPRYSGNGVSLTLGLPHCENFSVSGNHQNFLPNQNIPEPNEFSSLNASVPHSSAAYDTINIQNQRRFVAQLLPDYVA